MTPGAPCSRKRRRSARVEDAADLAAVAAARAGDAAFAARLRKERGAQVEVTIPIEVVEAKLDGHHPIKAWREHRGWTQARLPLESGVGRNLIAQIEIRRKTAVLQRWTGLLVPYVFRSRHCSKTGNDEFRK
jgi:hypothetical protein